MSETKHDDAVEQDELEEKDEKKTDKPEEDIEFSLDPKEDPRARIYDEIDKKRGVHQIPQEEDQTDEEDETEETVSTEEGEEKTEDDQTAEGDGTETTEEDPFKGKVLSQEDFLEAFGNVKVKAKIAGEEVEVTPGELLKVTGLERHMTKRLQVISKREAEVLKRAEGRSPVTDVEGVGPTEDEIRERYDELYAASPYEAQKYLDDVKVKRANAQTKAVQAQVDTDIADFKEAYPECTDADWEAMNSPAFWKQHDDIVKLRDSGNVFATLVTAYSRLQTSRVKTEEGGKEKLTEKLEKKTERKKQGQVIRTTVKPEKEKASQAKEPSKRDQDRAYILQLRKNAAARMRIPQ